MGWFEVVSFAGIVGTFMGVGIAVAAYFNGKHIKATEGRVLALLESNGLMQREMREETRLGSEEYEAMGRGDEQGNEGNTSQDGPEGRCASPGRAGGGAEGFMTAPFAVPEACGGCDQWPAADSGKRRMGVHVEN